MPDLWVDTDCGVDDAYALTLLLLSGARVDVTTVFGNVSVDQATHNARRLVATVGGSIGSIVRGAERPILSSRGKPVALAADVHGADGLGGWSTRLVDLGPSDAGPAEIADTISQSLPVATSLLSIGPLTNIACDLLTRGRVNEMSSITIMGGAEASGNVTASAEFNFWADPESAHIVLDRATCPITIVPLDLTDRLLVSAQWLNSLSDASTVGYVLAGLAGQYLRFYERVLGHPATPLHDLVAAAVAIWPDLAVVEPRRVAVDCSSGPSRGRMIVESRTVPEADDTAFREVSLVVAVDWPVVLERFVHLVTAANADRRPTSIPTPLL